MSRQALRIFFLIAIIAVLTVLHYLTDTEQTQYHGVYRRLYYLPVVLGGIWFALRGGVLVALLVSVLYAPHILFQWGYLPALHVEQYLEIFLFNLIGFATGFLSSRERMARQRAEENSQTLGDSYAKLREQADLILEIEDQLRRADRLTALGELSAGMAHEIRNPLGSIRGTAEILRDAFPEDNRYAEFTRILINEADRLNQVLEDFLSFARPESSERVEFNPDQVLDEVLQLTHQEARKKRLSILWDKKPIPAAVGEAGQFKQVFMNLILNALQAMDEGGQLWIESTVNEQRQILLQFRDNGPGIPADQLDRVFNPFFTTKQEGTGLGLAITSRIVQNHCGSIRVDNVPEGGAVFTLCLQPADFSCQNEENHGETDSID